MPYFSTELEIYVDEFISSCSKSEIKELIEALQEDGWLVKEAVTQDDKMTLQDEMWLEVTNKLNALRLKLSNEEEDIIRKIANKY